MTPLDIQKEIQEGKNLDVHIKSESKFVRKWVAQQGYKLEDLINDPAEEVRAAVASKGYGLDRLINDKSDWVKFAALQALDKIRKQNVGYDIVHRIEVADNHFVVGHNPKAPSPYVTWQFVEPKNYYCQGHYFSEEKDAIIDLFRRAGEEIDLPGTSLAQSLLTEDDHAALREESAREAVYYALEEILSGENPDYDYDSLVADEDFMAKALHRYWNIDHSYENEAFGEALQEILNDFPQHKIQRPDNSVVEVKIPPELHALVNELLNTPTGQIIEKYGPLGDNIEFAFEFGFGIKATIEIVPAYDLNDPNKLLMNLPHGIKFSVTDAQGNDLATNFDVWHSPDRNSDLTGNYRIELNNTLTLTLSIHEDEALRRVGNQFLFNSTTQRDLYGEHDGELCMIKRALTPKECDILQVGLMWEAEFPNRDIIHVFDHELTAIERDTPKPSLNDQLKAADAKRESEVKRPGDCPGHDRG